MIPTNEVRETLGQATAMPEWLSRQDMDQSAWVVQPGRPVRGDAWTNLSERLMRVPFGNDEASRVVRAHEMMHAKVSPQNWDAMASLGIPHAVIAAAEEYRVNSLVGVAGFDLNNLTDGSERTTGKRRAESGDWNGMVLDICAMAGTASIKEYIKGVKSENPELALAAKEVEKAVVGKWKSIAGRGRYALKPKQVAEIVGSTTPTANGLNQGFSDFTVPLARLLESLMTKPDTEDRGDDECDGEGSIPDAEEIKQAAKAGERGQFAQLIFDKDVVLSRRVDGRLGRKRVATNMGRNPRRIHRMLTDSNRRVFDRVAKGRGGVVLIDQSGSMHLGESDIWSILEAAPGCTIIGYSHKSGTTDQPNIWVLAENGKVCEAVRKGSGGNGVDGPAVRYAARKRRKSDPLIWVCDGYVTDGKGDRNLPNLNSECALLVVQHGIHMVKNPAEAVKALQRVATGQRLEVRAVGNVASAPEWKGHGREE